MFDQSRKLISSIKETAVPAFMLLAIISPFIVLFIQNTSMDFTLVKKSIFIACAFSAGILLYFFIHDIWSSFSNSDPNKKTTRLLGLVLTCCISINISIASYALYQFGFLNFTANKEITNSYTQKYIKKISDERYNEKLFITASELLMTNPNEKLVFNKNEYYFPPSELKKTYPWKINIGKITAPVNTGIDYYSIWLVNINNTKRIKVHEHLINKKYNGVDNPLRLNMNAVPKKWLSSLFLANSEYIGNNVIKVLDKEKNRPIEMWPFVKDTILSAIGVPTGYISPSENDHSIYVTSLIRMLAIFYIALYLSPVYRRPK